ncbi:MAG: hypothetical protein GY703_02085, partial [Gammaproteobacteria bacterium]|nr:hypothetical protein [Gammaproteobacteria bacterium]
MCLQYTTVDKRFSKEILKVISPHGLNASIAAIERLRDQGSDRQAALQRQLQQVEYEAQRAFDQYNQADP